MFNASFLSNRRNRPSPNTREQRQNRFVVLAICIGILLAVAFGFVLYTVNVSGRI